MRRRLAACAPLVFGFVLSSGSSGCAATLTRFPLAEPMWVDDDQRPFGPPPDEWYSPFIWDGADESVFRPFAELWRFELDREAIDVNALDEVPASSWFAHRLGRERLSPEVVSRGACSDADPGVGDDDIHGPFTITRAKPNGASPGFFVRDTRGITYLMKPDGGPQAERWGAADTIGAAVFWAAGYHTPCNRVVFVSRDDFTLAEGAEARFEDGGRQPLTQATVDAILSHAFVAPDGRLRVGLSQFVEGQPISAWTYDGTWADDPNDVVPHEHRRELRAIYVLSSWLSHIDSRQENTLASWIAVGEGGYVRHYVLDFSDSLGATHEWIRLARRLGYSGYFDLGHMAEDLFSLGAIRRPWDEVQLGPTGATLGYFDVEHYEPDRWRPGYPNPAFERMSERDAAWMARIVARFSDAHLRALVARGRFSRPVIAEELFRVLAGRRDRVLERWLTRLSPLGLPVVEGGRLCTEDLAVSAGIRSSSDRHYVARALVGDSLREVSVDIASLSDARVCVELPRGEGASREAPQYLVIDVVASSEGRETTFPWRVHAYDLGDEVRVVGLERPERGSLP